MDNFSPLEPMAPEKPFPWLAVVGGATFFILLVVGTLYFFVPGFNLVNILGIGQEEVTTSESTFTEFYVIRIANNTDLQDAQDFVESTGAEVSYTLSRSRVIIARISDSEKAQLERDERVVWIERQQTFERLSQRQEVAQATGVMRLSTASGVDVFIIDSGAGSLPGLNYATKSGVEIMYADGERVVTGTEDTNGHGTGVAYAFQTYLKDTENIRMHSIKDEDEMGKNIDLTAEAIYKAIESGAEVINISSGLWSSMDSRVYNEAIDAAKAAGVVVVVAAGNEADSKGENYLTQDPYVISVGALKGDGSVAGYSDGLVTGDEADVFAFGDVSIPGEETSEGTSFAAPRVAAAVSSFMAKPVDGAYDTDSDGRWDPDEVRKRLKDGIKKGEFPVMRDGEEVIASIEASQFAITDIPATGVTSTPVTGGTGGTTGTIGGGGPSVGGGTVFGGDTTFGDDTVYGVDGGSSESTSGSSGNISQAPRTSSFGGGSVSPSQSSLVQTQNANTFPQDEGPAGLVPCGDAGEEACQVCHVETLARDTLKFVIYVAIFIATLMIAYAGFKMITAQGDVGAVTEAKNMFLKVILGLVLVLTAWLIVDTLMRVFLRGSFGAWNDFGSCLEQPQGTLTGGTLSPGEDISRGEPVGNVDVGSVPFTGRTTDQAAGVQILKNGNIGVGGNLNVQGVSEDMLKTLVLIKQETGESFTVTAAKNGVHRNSCHPTGTCLDFVCTSCGGDTERLNKVLQSVKSKTYCGVYEPGGSCPAGVSTCRPNVGTGPHISFYSPTGPKDALCR